MDQNVLKDVRKIALSLHGVSESTSYGTPAFKLKNKLLARLLEDGETLALKMDFETRDFLLKVDPKVYYLTDHYKKYPYILVRLHRVDLEDLKAHFIHTWSNIAPKKIVEEYKKNQMKI